MGVKEMQQARLLTARVEALERRLDLVEEARPKVKEEARPVKAPKKDPPKPVETKEE